LFIEGWLWEFHETHGTHLFGRPNIFQAGLEPEAVAAAAYPFFQCNVVWRSFPQARGQGVKILILIGALFL
jgi:hypothetical protein